MTGYRFTVTCPKCGGPVDHTAAGISDGFRTQTVANCPPCRTTWRICVELRDVQADAITVGRLEQMIGGNA